jgi:rSAM/selenodomain-associated transferase 1
MRRALIVIGKAPIPGSTKTRLVPPLTPEDAAAVYRGFLLDTLELATSLAWECTSLIHPRGHAVLLRGLAPGGVRVVEQPGHGLGRALAYAFELHFAKGFESVTLIGSDNPTLPIETVTAAHAALERGSDVAIGPSADGGYYLIGMRQPHLALFEQIDWSTSRVYAQTLARAARLNLSVHSVREWYDVDEPGDLDRLRRELASAPAAVAPHTRHALEAIGAAPVP